MNRRILSVVGGVVAAAMVLAGCGSSGGGDAGDSGDSGSSGTQESSQSQSADGGSGSSDAQSSDAGSGSSEGTGTEDGSTSDGGDAGALDESNPYRVLVLGGVSAPGALGDNATTSVLSAKASADNVNKVGGIDGRKVVVTTADDQADPTVAVTKVREAINSDTPPDVIMNSGPSTIAEATLPIINQAGILSFNIGPTADSANPEKFPLNFDLSPGVDEYMKGFIKFIKGEGYQSVGILHGSSSYGETFGDRAEKDLTDAGIKVTKNEVYDTKALDMTAQISAIKATNPDALVLDAYGAPLGYILKGLDKLGWLDIPIVADNSVSATGLVSTPPPSGVLGTKQVANLKMEVFQSTKHHADDTLVNDAVKAMTAIGKIPSTLINAYNYDTMPLVKAAADKVGSADDPAKLAEALIDPDVLAKAKTAIIKNFHFTDKSHTPNLDADAFQFISPSKLKDGQYQ